MTGREFPPCEGRLTDGRGYVVRSATPGDAQFVVDLLRGVAGEGRFLLRDASDYDDFTAQDELEYVNAADGRVGLMLIAETRPGGRAGFLTVFQRERGRQAKVSHNVDLGLMLAPAERRHGLGRLLLTGAIGWAKAAGYRRIYVTVLATNEASLALFRGAGFGVESRLRYFVRIDDGFTDLVGLGLNLVEPPPPPGTAAGRAPDSAPPAAAAAAAAPVTPWPARAVALAGGETVRLRPGVPDDATPVLDMINAVARERVYILSDSFNISIEAERAFLASFDGAKGLMLVGEAPNERIVACADAHREAGGGAAKTRHAAWVGISLARDYRGRGLGKAIIGELVAWARGAGVRWLGAEVFATNQRSQGLFRRMGFVEQGRLLGHVCVDGRFVDLIQFGRLL